MSKYRDKGTADRGSDPGKHLLSPSKESHSHTPVSDPGKHLLSPSKDFTPVSDDFCF